MAAVPCREALGVLLGAAGGALRTLRLEGCQLGGHVLAKLAEVSQRAEFLSGAAAI